MKKRHYNASVWALNEYLKLPYSKLPDHVLSQIAKCRKQSIKKVKYQPDKIVIKFN